MSVPGLVLLNTAVVLNFCQGVLSTLSGLFEKRSFEVKVKVFYKNISLNEITSKLLTSQSFALCTYKLVRSKRY